MHTGGHGLLLLLYLAGLSYLSAQGGYLLPDAVMNVSCCHHDHTMHPGAHGCIPLMAFVAVCDTTSDPCVTEVHQYCCPMFSCSHA